MKVFITGNLGYVGSVLSRVLPMLVPNIQILGFDAGFFSHLLTGADTTPEHHISMQYFGDIRSINTDMLRGVDAVVHLAGISNDPIGNEFQVMTEDVNRHASVRLASIASLAGVKKFIFASSCSIYGQAEGFARKENDAKNPLTAYAKSKIATEDDIQNSDLKDMVFTSLRFATACGWSDRLRLDLVLNDLVACAMTSRKISLLSDGTPWRPLIDVEDMARAIAWAILRDENTGGQFLTINAGRNESNYQIKDLANVVACLIPNTEIIVDGDAAPDKRSYSVDFSQYQALAPLFQPKVTLEESVRRLRDGLRKMDFDDKDFRQSALVRLNALRKHVAEGRLGRDLRWIIRN